MANVPMTRAVRILIISCVSLFLIQLIGDTFFGTQIRETLGLVPSKFFDRGAVWQIITYMFMHADLFHILFNMLILWMIGSELEAGWGTKEFVKFYFICGISAALFYLIVQVFFRGTAVNNIPMVGSSGAIYGLLVAYGIIFSDRQMLFMMVFPMKAKHFVFILAGIEFISTVFYAQSGIANAAHLGGMIVGFSYLLIKAYFKIRKRQKDIPPQKRRKIRTSHLKLIVNNDELFKEFDTEDDDDDSQDDKPTVH